MQYGIEYLCVWNSLTYYIRYVMCSKLATVSRTPRRRRRLGGVQWILTRSMHKKLAKLSNSITHGLVYQDINQGYVIWMGPEILNVRDENKNKILKNKKLRTFNSPSRECLRCLADLKKRRSYYECIDALH